MKIAIRNFRGCERADLESDGITLVSGHNGNGKSSICLAVAAAITRQGIPFIKPGPKPGEYNALLAKGSAGALVKSGFAEGRVSIEMETGVVELKWPGLDIETTGKRPPQASVFTAGILDIVDLDDKKRAVALSNLIGATPTNKDLTQFLEDRKVSEETAAKLWEKIEADGWDVTYDKARDAGAKIKGQWEDVTGGERYGKSKAEGWMPAEWEAELENASRDDLEAAVTRAREALEKVVGKAAVSEADLEKLRAQAEAEAPDLDALEKEVADAEDNVKGAREELDACPAPDAKGQVLVECPHCGEKAALDVNRKNAAETAYALSKPKEVSEKAIKAARDKRQKAEAAVADAEKMAREARGKLGDAVRVFDGIKAAKEALASQKSGADQKKVDEAREAVRVAEERLGKYNAWSKAARLHKSMQQTQDMIDALDPKGVRRTVLLRALQAFNDRLKPISKAAGWESLTITADLDFALEGRPPFFLMCESEQFRVRAMIRMAIAEVEDSNFIIIDGADKLDASNRNGMFKALAKWCKGGRAALVGMTLNKPDQMPPLNGRKLGRCYWIEKGIATPASTNAPAR